MIRLSVYGINIILETDNLGVRYMLEYETTKNSYNPWMKKWIDQKIKGKIYNRKKTDPKTGHIFFEIGVGYAAYLLKVFGGDISKEDYNDVLSAVYQNTYRTHPFPELRDYQNQDILHCLKYKFGLFSCYTGYGKKKQTMKKNIKKEEIKNLIDNGFSVKEMCKELCISKRTLYNRFKEFGLSLIKPTPKFNINAFDSIDTEEKAYWLGFLYADGYVSKRNNQVELSLKGGDISHLMKFFNFLKDKRDPSFIKISKVKLGDKIFERCRYTIGNKHFHDRLCELGCIPNKSLILTFPDLNIFKYEYLIYDFIRGYVDGDGNISPSRGYIQISIFGTENFLLGVRKYFPDFSYPKKDKRNNVFFIRSSHKKAEKISSKLYKNATIFLDRKYSKFAELCRNI